ncbi:MAG: hypothetical protein NZ772_09230, partial [Cyanobacteria bacterium]|nr:hypothetical protein [Cyanobacteriota bacterium]MDW8201656.1 hypothetical protein [Cyanobacteriota bacterium SKYGB_h_bin112]
MGTSRYWIVCGVSMALALGGATGSVVPVAGAEPIAKPDSQLLSQLDAASLEAVNPLEPAVDQQQPQLAPVTITVMQPAMSTSVDTVSPNHRWRHLQLAQTGLTGSSASSSDAQPLRFSQDPIPV